MEFRGTLLLVFAGIVAAMLVSAIEARRPRSTARDDHRDGGNDVRQEEKQKHDTCGYKVLYKLHF